jgi:aminopeptidase N
VYGAGYPHYKISRQYSNGTLELTVRQVQEQDSTTGLFQLPIPLEFHLDSGVMTDTILVVNEIDTFRFDLPEEPRFVIFDAGDAILKDVDFPRSQRELTMQLFAPRMIDRLIAVEELGKSGKSENLSAIAEALHNAFRREHSPHVRQAIVEAMGPMVSGDSVHGGTVAVDEIRSQVIAEAMLDSAVDVRRAAIDLAYLVADRTQRINLLRVALADSSRYNAVSALATLAAMGQPGLEDALVQLRSVIGRRGGQRSKWIGAVQTGGYIQFVDDVARFAGPANPKAVRLVAYTTLKKFDTLTAAMRTAFEIGLRDDDSTVRARAALAVRSHQDELTRQMLRRLQQELTGASRKEIEAILNNEPTTEEHGL